MHYGAKLRISSPYANIIDKTKWSHAHGRSVFHLSQGDVDAARLFSYVFRSQAIGNFHASRLALETQETLVPMHSTKEYLRRASILLDHLEGRAGETVPKDFRCLLYTLFYYNQWIKDIIELIERAAEGRCQDDLQQIKHRFVTNIERVTRSTGIYLASDCTWREQGVFTVPNLGISIAPMIYGDQHSWNIAFMPADKVGVAVHRHRKGAEIHLGFSPLEGNTILG